MASSTVVVLKLVSLKLQRVTMWSYTTILSAYNVLGMFLSVELKIITPYKLLVLEKNTVDKTYKLRYSVVTRV